MSASSSLRISAPHVRAPGHVALDLVLEGDPPQLGEDAFEAALVADDGLGELAPIGQAIALGQQPGPGADR